MNANVQHANPSLRVRFPDGVWRDLALYYTVADRTGTPPKWRSADYGRAYSDLSVIPEPIVRFMTGAKHGVDFNERPSWVYYESYQQARDDLNRACRLFVREAAKQSRARVLARGGT